MTSERCEICRRPATPDPVSGDHDLCDLCRDYLREALADPPPLTPEMLYRLRRLLST